MKRAIALLLLSFVLGTLAQNTLTLTATIRDFTPSKCPVNFEGPIRGLETGLVNDQLGSDDKPVRSNIASDTIPLNGPGCFNSWFRDDADQNIRFSYDLTLTETAPGSGVFSYGNNDFFPINGQGWGDYFNNRNYHFCMEVAANFTYLQGQVFSFSGDDDVWVFINRRLAVDIGGVHGRIDSSVNLDTLGLVNGTDYPFHFFFCERHTSESNFFLTTSLVLRTDPPQPPSDPTLNFCGVEVPAPCLNSNENCLRASPAFTQPIGSVDFFQYNAISFGDFIGSTADTEGRVAARGNFQVQNGYSVGNLVVTEGGTKILDQATFALLVGGSARWEGGDAPTGSVEPDGRITNPSPKEFTFTGTPGNNRLPVGVDTNNVPLPNLNSEFTYGQQYYTQLSNFLATLPANTNAAAQFSTITITCNSNTATSYVLDLDANTLTQGTSWAWNNCNQNAQLLVNIRGTGNVNFGIGRHLEFTNVVNDNDRKFVRILWNIVGTGRTVSLNTLYGHLLMPGNVLNQVGGVIYGLVIAGRVAASHQINIPTCPRPPVNPPQPPQPPTCPSYLPALQGECLAFYIDDEVFSFNDFNVISFGSFSANTGDVQGRLLVAGNVNLGAGYSVGDQINTVSGQDNALPFSLIAGGNVNWLGGALYPWDIEGKGTQEYMYVGGTFTGATDLGLLVRESVGLDGSLQNQLNRFRNCLVNLQNDLAVKRTNVAFEVKYSGLFIDCSGNTGTEYVLNVDASVINSITWYSLDNCNPLANWIINVQGTGDVSFSGGHLEGVSGVIIWNILGSGRTITVSNIELHGSILAPRNSLNQPGGVIIGNVFIGDYIFALQVNIAVCPRDVVIPPIDLDNCVEDAVPAGEGCFTLCSEIELYTEDTITIGGVVYSVSSREGRRVCLGRPLISEVAASARVVVTINNPQERYAGTPAPAIQNATSNAGIFKVSVAVLAALIALVALF